MDNSLYEIGLKLQTIQHYIANICSKAAALLDEQGNIIACSPVLLEATGYALADLKMKSVRKVICLEQPISEFYLTYFCRSEPLQALPVLHAVTRHGQSFSSRSVLYMLRQNKERYYLMILHDLQKFQTLNLLQQFAGTFMKDVNLGVLLISPDFTLVDISDMACRILGIERDTALNRSLDEVFATVPAEHRLVQRTILDGLVVRNHAVSWMNNRERYELLLDSSILKDQDGNTVGAYVLFKDVTNLRSLEQQVQRSDRLAMIGQIAAGTAHEIRNPLTAIKGFLQMLNTTFQEKEMRKEKEFTQIMLSEIDRINDLVNEFLLLSKPKNVTYDRVDVSAVLMEILPIIKNEALLHKVTVHYAKKQDLPEVIADRELLKQVYLNICKNGIEAMVEGGHLTISERIDVEERKIHIDFHDTGPGIPVFVIDKIFDPFFTTKPNGTGLGLSVCQRIIHDIGGTIRVSSKGFGTTFTISIPIP